MTEDEWLTTADPFAMLRQFIPDFESRRIWLLQAASLRNVRDEVSDTTLAWGEVLERVGEGDAPPESANEGWETVESELGAMATREENDPDGGRVWAVMSLLMSAWASRDPWTVAGEGWRREQAFQADLIRCIFGNPFRPVTLDPNWLTSTVREMAASVYESREFGVLPVLADALQDAGCESDPILSHLRGPGPHARGCWVLDLILGKA